MRASLPHVLVVDDDPAIGEALSAALKGIYVVHEAAAGEAACAELRRHPVAAIVLDAMLGREHGLDLIERFRTLSQAPIVILTGHSTEALAIRALWAKVDGYLKKPVGIEELRKTLAGLIVPAPPAPDAAERARRHLEQHLERTHSTGALARLAGLSERQLFRQFREIHGKTPRRYLTEVRMRRAADLLRTTRLGIEQIAQAVGYQNIAAFDRTFKRALGVTPSEWRAAPGPPSRRKPRA
jgi:YesN/AraC family two-component response regulator